METKTYDKVKIKTSDSMATIEGSISPETLESHKKLVIADLKKNVEVPGFRKGNAPEDMIISHVGEGSILEKLASSALQNAYPDIVKDNDIKPISIPRITVTKLASGNPLEFKIEVALMPKFSLPNYKKIAKEVISKKQKPEVTEKEIDDVIAEVQKIRGKEEETKELTDETVKELGNFKSIADLKEKVKENLLLEKEVAEQKKTRQDIIAEIGKETKLTVPKIMIEDELQNTRVRLSKELEKRQMKKEDYLKAIKKTEEEFWKEEEGIIEKQLKDRFILKEIAEKEQVKIDDKEIEHELKHLKTHYPEADEDRLRGYVEEILVNEKIFSDLEKENK